jgi:hypothetical protein
MRFWYLVTTAGAHVQGFCGSEKKPQEQGYSQSNIFLHLANDDKLILKVYLQYL